MLACPCCSAPLRPSPGEWRCEHCHAAYGRTPGGVPDLFVTGAAAGEDEAVTAAVNAFYEEQPFPDYRDHDDVGSLVRRGRRGAFTRALDDALAPGARVVEVGCGTGQLSMFLAATGRQVIGLDLCAASLDVAACFARDNGVASLLLLRGNLFRPPLAPRWADVVLCNGVLHHTGAPRRGFAQLAGLLRPGGYLVCGLYNRFGRLLLPLRRAADRREATTRRGMAWWRDQHRHPHEVRHSLDEVLGWVAENGLEFVRWIPPLPTGATLWTPAPKGNRLTRLALQLSWLRRAEDGGLWLTVARRPREPVR